MQLMVRAIARRESDMGVYDTFGDTQIKAGPCAMKHYKIGQSVPLENGVYVAPDGVVVIAGGIFVAEFSDLRDKWGGRLDCDTVLDARHPIKQAMRAIDGAGNRSESE